MENSLTSFVSPNALGLLVLLQPQSRSSLIIDDSRSSSVFLRFCDIYLWEKEYWEYSKLYIEQSGLVAISIYTQFDSISRKYFILWDIVDPRNESNPNPNPNPEPNPKPNPNPNPNPNLILAWT